MDGSSPCRFLDWDSEFFGRRIASVSSPGLDRAAMDRVLEWRRRERIDCLYLLSDAGDLVTLRLAEERGFRLVDVRVTLDRTIDAAPGAGWERIRSARPSDVPELRAIAATSHTASRFYADGRFERARCDELYATWIEKSCAGFADAVWVAEVDGRASGYLTCHRRENGRGEIGLVALVPSGQGQGLGRELVLRGLAWFREQGLARATVVTQGANVGAQRLYQSAGFRTSALQLWHHGWFDGWVAEEGGARR